MNLTFTIEVEADKSWIPYIKKVLAGKMGWAGNVKSVVCTSEMDDVDREIEYSAWERGEIDL